MLLQCKKHFCYFLLSGSVLALLAFKSAGDKKPELSWIQQCLTTCFDPGKQRLKKWELNVNEQGFLRFKKVFLNGKQEYYSFNLKRFKTLSYLGTSISGRIIIATDSSDIIVQTFNDPKGNIDSMASRIDIPVANVEAEQLDSLTNSLDLFNN